MLILAIDPGPDHSALVSWTGERVELARDLPNADMLKQMHELYHLRTRSDALLVIEKVASYGKPVGAAVFETVWWSGRFAEAFAASTGCPVARMEFSDVRLELCRSRNAKESHVRRALLDRIGEPVLTVPNTPTNRKPVRTRNPVYGEKVTGHCWSALALAVAAEAMTVWKLKEEVHG